MTVFVSGPSQQLEQPLLAGQYPPMPAVGEDLPSAISYKHLVLHGSTGQLFFLVNNGKHMLDNIN